MRTIEFRGKRKEDGKWVYGNYLRTQHYKTGEDLHEIISNVFLGGPNSANHINHDTVGQYTGLQDCNGVKIFEGDILEFGSWGGQAYHRPVYFTDGAFAVNIENKVPQLLYTIQNEYETEVIGNIHDNPGLLEGE
jgi:uncharacterized phage protein (TIGR01671 family)